MLKQMVLFCSCSLNSVKLLYTRFEPSNTVIPIGRLVKHIVFGCRKALLYCGCASNKMQGCLFFYLLCIIRGLVYLVIDFPFSGI